MIKTYIAGALTNLDNDKINLKEFYEKISELCSSLNIDAFVPHLKFDPIKYPHFTPKEVYENESEQVRNREILIAYVGEPSLGVGGEIEIAKNSNSKIILLYENGKKVSRFARGNPAVFKKIVFADENDALEQLKKVLNNICAEIK